MSYGVQVEVWGPYALFSRPELKAERVSYDVITPSAARGLIEAIFWHPGLRYCIDAIHVLKPVRFTSIRRNEVKSKASAKDALSAMRGGDKPLGIVAPQDILQRAAMVLTDVHYVLDAHFEMTERAAPSDNPGKFKDILTRRLEKGQCYHTPCFGCREFPASFRAWQGGRIPVPEGCEGRRDLGLMLYDMDYSNPRDIQPLFFRAVMEEGTIRVAGEEVYR
ncbi:type I-C CRISPR-associated protein Cas5 [Anaerofilum sp. BX8]|uniref:pre-crRNA processing endonuclease n=1 Tax=Anaerofilum hominis TaxID=2763016 RepID=A0A923I853_9FIRM|nr:type I-C CRISPR-associated protein Cas5c [Anaerofilum hominis]MBC5582046.1 type I-C CRISPR-associated protein Cas5 [Anaerofilum hominis]